MRADGRNQATPDEQQALKQFVGWGSVKGLFQNQCGKFGSGFESMGRELKTVLSSEEYLRELYTELDNIKNRGDK